MVSIPHKPVWFILQSRSIISTWFSGCCMCLVLCQLSVTVSRCRSVSALSSWRLVLTGLAFVLCNRNIRSRSHDVHGQPVPHEDRQRQQHPRLASGECTDKHREMWWNLFMHNHPRSGNPIKNKKQSKKRSSHNVWGGEFCGLRNYKTKKMAWEYLVRVVFHQKFCCQHIKSSTELCISAVLICTFYYTSGRGAGTLTDSRKKLCCIKPSSKWKLGSAWMKVACSTGTCRQKGCNNVFCTWVKHDDVQVKDVLWDIQVCFLRLRWNTVTSRWKETTV